MPIFWLFTLKCHQNMVYDPWQGGYAIGTTSNPLTDPLGLLREKFYIRFFLISIFPFLEVFGSYNKLQQVSTSYNKLLNKSHRKTPESCCTCLFTNPISFQLISDVLMANKSMLIFLFYVCAFFLSSSIILPIGNAISNSSLWHGLIPHYPQLTKGASVSVSVSIAWQ